MYSLLDVVLYNFLPGKQQCKNLTIVNPGWDYLLLSRTLEVVSEDPSIVVSIREMADPHDGIRFESTGVTHKLSSNKSVYIQEIGQAVVGDVAKKQWDRVLIVFTNIKKVYNEPHYSLVRAIWVNNDFLA